jgi:predicted ATPase
MIASLTIERFKSIRSLTVACRKINIFIGPPDTGKTNRIFQQELEDLHARSRERRVDTLVTELERALREIVR